MPFFNVILYFLLIFDISVVISVTLLVCSITNVFCNVILYFLLIVDVSLVTSVTLVACSITNAIFKCQSLFLTDIWCFLGYIGDTSCMFHKKCHSVH